MTTPTVIATTSIFGIPASIVAIGAILAVVIPGVLYVIGLVQKARGDSQKTKDDRVTAADNATMFVINALKEQVAVLEKKVEQQTKDIQQNAAKLETMVSENKLLREVLQGRDKETQEYQAQARLAFKRADQVYEIVNTTNKNVERLYKAIEKHLSLMEKAQTVTVTTGGIENPLHE